MSASIDARQEFLNTKVRAVNFDNGDEVIEFYRTNIIYFKNLDSVENLKLLTSLLTIKFRYGYALFYKSHLEKVYPVIEEIREHLPRLKENEKNYNNFTVGLLFLKARTLNNQHKYVKAHPLLKKLVTDDPDNHLYKQWFLNNSLGRYKYIFDNLNVVVSIMIFLDLILYFGFSVNIYFVYPGLLLLGGSYASWYILKQSIKKKLMMD